MHFLTEHLNSKQKKLNTNNSASKARMLWQKLGLLKPIFNKKCSIFSLIFSLYKYFCKHMD